MPKPHTMSTIGHFSRFMVLSSWVNRSRLLSCAGLDPTYLERKGMQVGRLHTLSLAIHSDLYRATCMK